MTEVNVIIGTRKKFLFSCPCMKFFLSSCSVSLLAYSVSTEWKVKLNFKLLTFLSWLYFLSRNCHPKCFIRSSWYFHARQLSLPLTSESIFFFGPRKPSSLPIFSDSFSIWCKCFHTIWSVFLANFINLAITLGHIIVAFFFFPFLNL